MAERRRVQSNPRWYGLDNAARIYPAVRSSDWGAVFRLALYLDREVDPARLDAALADTLRRLPLFDVSLRRGLFWYYHERLGVAHRAVPDGPWPCSLPEAQDNEAPLFRVTYRGNRVAAEFFHSLTDGTGGMAFLKTLIARYLALGGESVPAEDGVLDCGASPDPAEAEDAFLRHAGPPSGGSFAEDRAWDLPFPAEPPPILHVTHGLAEAAPLLAAAKEQGGTLTGLLSGVLMLAFDALAREEDGVPEFPVKISIPVNMRKFHETKSLRNFSLFTNAALPLREEAPGLREAVAASMEAMRVGHAPEVLARMMALNVATAANPALGAAPLFLKNLAIRAAWAFVGDSRLTASLSNLGVVGFPGAMADRVRRVDFVLGRPRGPGINCGVAGHAGRVVISLSSSVRDRRVERHFFRTLAGLGVPLFVESNQE